MEKILNKATVFNQLPPIWPTSPLAEIRRLFLTSGKRLVVLDDDPTGTQTVHNVPILNVWDIEMLTTELTQSSVFFILTNSRSLPKQVAIGRNLEIAQNLQIASREAGVDFFVLSRSDSTLRGHYPAEIDALTQALSQDFDATILVPYFEAGGRFTYENTHYVQQGEDLVPAALTEFSKDRAFPYSHSYLPKYVEEKTEGRIKENQVYAISIEDIRKGGPKIVFEQLQKIPRGAVIVLNACHIRDLEVAVKGLLMAQDIGKKYIYRTAASFVRVLVGMPLKPLLNAQSMALDTKLGGIMIVGSHIQKSSRQLKKVLLNPKVNSLELSVKDLLIPEKKEKFIKQYVVKAHQAIETGKHLVAYTSRSVIKSDSAEASLQISRTISESICKIVQQLKIQPKFLIAKGGITSNDIASIGLGVKRAMVAGQLQPGVPVWKLGAESKFPNMYYVVYPGNVGGEDGLAKAIEAFD